MVTRLPVSFINSGKLTLITGVSQALPVTMPSVIVHAQTEADRFVINNTQEVIILPKGLLVGVAERADAVLGTNTFQGPVETTAAVRTVGMDSITETSDSATAVIPVGWIEDTRPWSLPSHMTDMASRSRDHLNYDESQVLRKVLFEFQDVVSPGDFDIVNFGEITHGIDTAWPIRQRLLKSGVIEPSVSEWVSPSVLVRKCDSSPEAMVHESVQGDIINMEATTTRRPQVDSPEAIVHESVQADSGNMGGVQDMNAIVHESVQADSKNMAGMHDTPVNNVNDVVLLQKGVPDGPPVVTRPGHTIKCPGHLEHFV